MKVDPVTGRIAYHSLRFNPNGGTDFVQYDFDGSVESVSVYRPAPDFSRFLEERRNQSWLHKLIHGSYGP